MNERILRTTGSATVIVLLLAGCGNKEEGAKTAATSASLFTEVPADSSGVRFANMITESPDVNYFTYVYAYNGGGVAVGDLDNDGLQDLWFTGNQVPDRIYHNTGGLHFQDITEKAIGAKAGQGWRTGVAMADVNADGWLDVYVCRSGPTQDPALTRNLLFINNHDLTFTERAHEFGVDDSTHSTQAAFFDFDKDGDLDLYVINTPPNRVGGLSNFSAIAAVRAHTAPTCRLFRNNSGHFTDVTYDAGTENLIYGLGLGVADIDQDGWPDIYNACDFDSPDLMYINAHNGQFREELQQRTHHISNFGMGCDIADMNNDAHPDIVVLDMTADDHLRNKTNMGSMSPERFWANVRGGYFFQYMVNTLQLNNGNGTFSEIGQMAGVARTDWSWAPLMADLDNDGWKDLMVTNGFKHDVRNNDYAQRVYDTLRSGQGFFNTLDLIPSTRLRNYLFRNNGDLTFADSSQAWGFEQPENSNGAAYADLDNDGDLDLVINNLDETASIYRNTSDSHADRHWLRLDLRDRSAAALGAKAYARVKGSVQYQELYPVRGYQSCVEPLLHFGLGAANTIDTLEIEWPNGAFTLLTNVKTDQMLKLDQSDASAVRSPRSAIVPLFEETAAARGLNWTHHENPYDDFKLEVLLPHKQSENGPLLGVGDANGDGLDDLFSGAGHGHSAELWLQNSNGTFKEAPGQPWKEHAQQETLGSVFFDADGDGDQDLLTVIGGSESDLREAIYTQRLYTNDGRGNYAEANGALPPIMTSAMRAAAADIDADGDMDLYIGGRITPAHYPFAPRSYLLVNDGKGHFQDATQQLAPDAMGPGLVTSVVFTDIDNDKDPDLLLAGEWMNITILRNDQGRFTNVSTEAGLDNTHGWWYSLAAADVNGDGYQDLIGGNLGWNSKFKASPEKPVHVYWADFDGNGRHDIVLAKEKNGHQLPVRGRQCSSQQCPMIADKFKTYEEFAKADLSMIYTPEKLAKAVHLSVTFMRSAVFINDGHGKFTPMLLPNLAQAAPITGIVPLDVNGDGKLDLVVAGNNWGAEVETVRYDAGTGLVLLGDGTGSFTPMSIAQSGFFAFNNVKDLALVRTGKGKEPLIVVANNNDPLQAFAPKHPSSSLSALSSK